jgi:hypothetical protein
LALGGKGATRNSKAGIWGKKPSNHGLQSREIVNHDLKLIY